MSIATTELDELRETLHATELFEMLARSEVRMIAEAGRVREYRRGEYLFRRGDEADCLHLLIDGAIEIVRPTNESPVPVPVAYVSPGELIGDMALFTGSPRRSDGRVPERARIWTLTRAQFRQIAAEIPNYGMELAGVFARRLQELITHMRRLARRKELTGKLKYFDMPTVIQTLINGGQVGLLNFVGETGETYAELLIRSGRVERARCGCLEGDEAFYEIFLHKDDGEFYFRNLVDPNPETVSSMPIVTPAIHLMMEAMRRADELNEMRERIQGTSRAYATRVDKLRWEDPCTEDVAAAVLTELGAPQTVEYLRGRISCSSYTLYAIVCELLESGQIG